MSASDATRGQAPCPGASTSRIAYVPTGPALGSPWTFGDRAFVQACYRELPAPKTTGLSDAVELTYVP